MKNRKGFTQAPTFLNAGFTLIELLVVVSVIGLLAAIALTSLNRARYRAANAAVMANMTEMRTEIELVYTNNNNYDSICNQAATAGKMFEAAAKQSNQGVAIYGMCLSSGAACARLDSGVLQWDAACKAATAGQWAVSMGFKDDSGYYCIDYLGNKKIQATRGIDNSPLDLTCN